MSDVPERVDQDDDLNEAVGPDVNIPGPYPTGQAPSSVDTDASASHSSQSEPTKETREAASLGDLTKETSTSTVAGETAGLRSPAVDEEETAKKEE